MSEQAVRACADENALTPDPLSAVKILARKWRWPGAVAAAVLLILGLVVGGRASRGDVATWVLVVIDLAAFLAALDHKV